MQRHLAGLAELGVPDAQHAGGGVDIPGVQRDDFPDAHPGAGQHAEERAVGRALERGQRGGGAAISARTSASE